MCTPSILLAALLLSLGFAGFTPRFGTAQTSVAGARDAALAGSSAASAAGGGLWADANPAGSSELSGSAVAVHVSQLYGLPELRAGALRAGFAILGTALVAGVRTFGYSDYRETAFGLAAARAIRWGTFRPFQAGIRVRNHRVAIPSYGSASALAVSGGLIVPMSFGTNLAFAAENALVAGELYDDLPRRLHAGVSVSTGAVQLMAAASKDARTPLAVRGGVEVYPHEVVALRGGYSLQPPRLAGGIGLLLSPLVIDLAAERHFVLGWTPSCTVQVRW